MNEKDILARRALRGALETRQRAGVEKTVPICVYDVAERLQVEVIFCNVDSLVGMYAKASQTIVISSCRPPGRRAYTCGHELGHWYFGHGGHIDEITDIERSSQSSGEEYLANVFAGYLLMPPWAIKDAFARRKWNPAECTPFQIYLIAGQFGVGYETAVQHLRWSLNLISPFRAESLLKCSSKQIRQEILNSDVKKHLVIVDREWVSVPVDLQVGEMAILPASVRLEGESAETVKSHKLGTVIEGRVPGITRAESIDGRWATFIRVSPQNFQGRSIYRHLEDPDVNESANDD